MKISNKYIAKRFIHLTFVICYLSFIGFAYADTGTTIDISRTIYSGRTLGMGGAHAALSNDGEGIFTNPSGLAKITFPQMMGLSRKLVLEETTYTLYGFAMPTNWGTFGIGYSGAQIGGSYPTMRDAGTNRIIINPSQEAIGYENSVILLTYARAIPWQNLSVGGSLKIFNQSINGSGRFDRASSYGVDLSASYQPMKYLNLGVNLQNLLGSSIAWTNASEKMGGYTKLGAAMTVLGPDSSEAFRKYGQKVTAAFDLDLPRDVLNGSMLMHLGAEWELDKIFSLRAGFNQEAAGTGMTLGLGIKNSAFRFDYAYAARPGLISDNPHYFSLSYVGDRTVSTTRKLKRKESGIAISSPADRTITSQESIMLMADIKVKAVYEEKTIWEVPLISSTSEAKELYELEQAQDVRLQGRPIYQQGTVETITELNPGRNAIELAAYTTPEAEVISNEVRVLRITPPKDMKMSYWAMEPIALNSTLGIIKGYSDGTFKPEKGITRAELTALLVRTGTFDQAKWEQAQDAKKFADIKNSLWYAPFINYGVDLGLVTGYPDKTFKPDKVLNRAEGITVIARFAKLAEKEGLPFSDLKSGFWANKFIQAAKDAGILKYLEGGDFKPGNILTRAEAAEVLYRTSPIQKKVNDFWDKGVTPETAANPATSESR